MCNTLIFCRKNVCTNAPQCYVRHRLPVLLNLTATSIAHTIGSYHQREMSEARLWTIGGMVLTDETRSNRTKPVPAPLCLPDIPHGLTLRVNPCHCGKVPATNRQCHCGKVSATNRQCHCGKVTSNNRLFHYSKVPATNRQRQCSKAPPINRLCQYGKVQTTNRQCH